MDIADRAQINEERERSRALAAQQVNRNEAPLEVDGTRVCLNCMEEIETSRLAANPRAVRCTDCQTIFEKHGES